MVKRAPKATESGAPVKPKSGYFRFADSVRDAVTAQIRAKLEAAGEKFTIVAVGKQISEQWKDVSAEQKKEYAALFQEESAEYKKKYTAWAQTQEGKQYAVDLSSFKKQKGDSEAKEKLYSAGYPKKPLSAYFMFSGEQSKLVVAELVAEGKGKGAKERSVKIKERWEALGEAGQQVYQKRYADAKAKYIEEKTAFEANNPAFREYDAAVEKNKAAHAKRLNKGEPSAKRRKVADSVEPAAEESPIDEEEESPEEDEESPEE